MTYLRKTCSKTSKATRMHEADVGSTTKPTNATVTSMIVSTTCSKLRWPARSGCAAAALGEYPLDDP